MGGGIEFAFQFGTLPFAQKRRHRAMTEDKLQVERLRLLKTKAAQHTNDTLSAEREGSFVDAQFRFRIKEFELLHLRHRPLRLVKSSAPTVNDQIFFARINVCMNVTKFAAGFRRRA